MRERRAKVARAASRAVFVPPRDGLAPGKFLRYKVTNNFLSRIPEGRGEATKVLVRSS